MNHLIDLSFIILDTTATDSPGPGESVGKRFRETETENFRQRLSLNNEFIFGIPCNSFAQR